MEDTVEKMVEEQDMLHPKDSPPSASDQPVPAQEESGGEKQPSIASPQEEQPLAIQEVQSLPQAEQTQPPQLQAPPSQQEALPQHQTLPQQTPPQQQQSTQATSNGDVQQQEPVNSASEPEKPNICIRAGCTNLAIAHSEWEDEYCSNECVVNHCRDVFNAWVATNQSSAVK